MAQTTTTLVTLPPANHNSGTVSTATRTNIPANFDYVTITVQCTSGNISTPFTGFSHPFNDPSMQLTFGIKWSWDGGSTFPESTEASLNGNAAGTWGSDKQGNPNMVPDVNLGIPSNASLGGRPTAYQAYASLVNGPVTFGITATETTG